MHSLRLTPPSKKFTLLALASALVAAVGCSTSTPIEGDDSAPAMAVVSIAIHGQGVEAVSLHPEAHDDRPPDIGAARLRWELDDGAGNLLDQGEAADPRAFRAEFADGAQIVGANGRAPAGLARVRLRDVGGRLTLFEEDGDDWIALGSTTIPGSGGAVGTSSEPLIQPSTDILGDIVPLSGAGDPGKRINLLILPEGYTEAELPKFHADADQVIKNLQNVAGYGEHWSDIAFFRQDIRSASSGIADPLTGKNPTTAFEMTFGKDGTSVPRRCVLFDSKVESKALAAIQSLTEEAAADAVIFVVNSDEYGGCSEPWNRLVTVTRNAQSSLIAAHELGHTLFKLADEYGGTTCGAFMPGPNVASDPHAVPWADLLTTTQLPTSLSTPNSTVGAFEGAAYCDHGVYRPEHTCMMRDLGAPFCPVCAREAERVFDARAGALDGDDAAPPATGGTLTLTNQTGAGLYVKCAGSVGPSCADWTWLAVGKTASIATNVAGSAVYLDNTTAGSVKVVFKWKLVTPNAATATVYANATNPLSPK